MQLHPPYFNLMLCWIDLLVPFSLLFFTNKRVFVLEVIPVGPSSPRPDVWFQ